MPTADYSSYHQSSGTGADGTKFSNFIDAVQATVNALDKNNLAAAAGILPAQLADPTAGKVLGSAASACAAVFPPSYEINHTEFTGSVAISATTEGTATTLVSPGAITFDGTPVWLKFFAPYLDSSGAAAYTMSFVLYEGSSSIGLLGKFQCPATGTLDVPPYLTKRFTPSAGAHTYSVRAFGSVSGGTVVAGTGAASAGVYSAGYLNFSKA